ncbi:hypothetical protein HK101_001274 [Irineochytrium annulatum]|nr:hypothetical protein HK101_001274 [Irineochytrium annulatum]
MDRQLTSVSIAGGADARAVYQTTLSSIYNPYATGNAPSVTPAAPPPAPPATEVHRIGNLLPALFWLLSHFPGLKTIAHNEGLEKAWMVSDLILDSLSQQRMPTPPRPPPPPPRPKPHEDSASAESATTQPPAMMRTTSSMSIKDQMDFEHSPNPPPSMPQAMSTLSDATPHFMPSFQLEVPSSVLQTTFCSNPVTKALQSKGFEFAMVPALLSAGLEKTISGSALISDPPPLGRSMEGMWELLNGDGFPVGFDESVGGPGDDMRFDHWPLDVSGRPDLYSALDRHLAAKRGSGNGVSVRLAMHSAFLTVVIKSGEGDGRRGEAARRLIVPDPWPVNEYLSTLHPAGLRLEKRYAEVLERVDEITQRLEPMTNSLDSGKGIHDLLRETMKVVEGTKGLVEAGEGVADRVVAYLKRRADAFEADILAKRTEREELLASLAARSSDDLALAIEMERSPVTYRLTGCLMQRIDAPSQSYAISYVRRDGVWLRYDGRMVSVISADTVQEHVGRLDDDFRVAALFYERVE